jgi:arsenite methyltransferase
VKRAAAPYLLPSLRNATGPALRPGGLEITRRSLAYAELAPGARVLDLGCGPGHSLGYLARELGLCVTGLDIEAKMLAEAGEVNPGIGLLRADARCLPLAQGAFNCVLAECVVSLMPDPKAVMTECRRVMAPGGVLLMNDLYWRRPPAGGHDRTLPGCLGGARSRNAWERLLDDAGFEVKAWEDHSRLLRELTARLVWEHGSADAFWGAWCLGGAYRTAMADAALYRPGYFLLVAAGKEDPVG